MSSEMVPTASPVSPQVTSSITTTPMTNEEMKMVIFKRQLKRNPGRSCCGG